MHPCKGVREAIDIARAADMSLRIAAKMQEPAEYDYFEAEIEPLLDRNISYLGELGPADKYALMGSSRALLNPIQWAEPFGLVMIEALATGTPVVTTPQGSAPEIVDDGVTGYLRQTTAGLAAALRDTATLDRARCRVAAHDRFSTERMVLDHLNLYTDLHGNCPINSEVVPIVRSETSARQRGSRMPIAQSRQ
jgi:glycosyltransferase involved in cell wall biosynthesis